MAIRFKKEVTMEQRNGLMLSDEEIIALFFERDESAITETDRKYKSYLFAIANNILYNEQDSEECVNDTYLNVWNTVLPTRPIRFRPFLAKITRNLAFDKYDEASRKKRIPRASLLSFDELEGFVSNKSTPESELEAKAISEVINSYLKNTSDKKLYIFVSRYFFAIPIAKIAEKLGCSEASVNKCIAEIKKELRKIFESEGIDI